MEKIVYSSHLIFRLKLREIPYNLPREIYQTSKEHYEEINNQINLITIHPLKYSQKINKIREMAKIMKKLNSKKIINPVRNSKIQRKYYFRELKPKSSKISNGVNYDQKSDVLYIGVKKGIEEEFIEISPGINVELDQKDQVIGIEILNASKMLKAVVKPLQKQILEQQLNKNCQRTCKKILAPLKLRSNLIRGRLEPYFGERKFL